MNPIETIADLDAQIQALYARKELLERQQEAKDAHSIISLFPDITFVLTPDYIAKAILYHRDSAAHDAFEMTVCTYCGSHDGTKSLSGELELYAGDGAAPDIHSVIYDGDTQTRWARFLTNLRDLGVPRENILFDGFEERATNLEGRLSAAKQEWAGMLAMMDRTFKGKKS